MAFDDPLLTLRERYARLQSEFGALLTTLQSATDRVRRGLLPDHGVGERVRDTVATRQAVLNDIAAVSNAIGRSLRPNPDASLAELGEFVGIVSEDPAWRAHSMLEGVAGLACPDASLADHELEVVRAAAREVLKGGRTTLSRIVVDHPIAVLHRLILGAATMEGRERNLAERVVGEAYSWEVAEAARFGRLVLGSAQREERSDAPSGLPQERATEVETRDTTSPSVARDEASEVVSVRGDADGVTVTEPRADGKSEAAQSAEGSRPEAPPAPDARVDALPTAEAPAPRTEEQRAAAEPADQETPVGDRSDGEEEEAEEESDGRDDNRGEGAGEKPPSRAFRSLRSPAQGDKLLVRLQAEITKAAGTVPDLTMRSMAAPAPPDQQPDAEPVAASTATLVRGTRSSAVPAREPVWGTRHAYPNSSVDTWVRGMTPNASPDLRDVAEVVWLLMRDDRMGLAHVLADAIYADDPTVPRLPDPATITGLALCDRLTSVDGDIARGVVDVVARLFEVPLPDSPDDTFTVEAMLRLVIAMPAAILLPDAYTAQVLASLASLAALPPSLGRFARKMSDVAARGLSLAPFLVVEGRAQAEWDRRLAEWRTRFDVWYAQAASAVLLFQRATDLWSGWCRPGGRIHAMLGPIQGDRREKLADVERAAAELSNQRQRRAAIAEADARLSNRDDPPIQARALERLESHVEAAVKWATEWCTIQRARPPAPDDGTKRHVEHVREVFRDTVLEVRKTLDTLQRKHLTSVRYCIACDRLRRAIDRCERWFSEGLTPSGVTSTVADVLNRELICLHSTALPPPDGEAVAGPVLATLLEIASKPPVSWSAAVDARLACRDYPGAYSVVGAWRRSNEHAAAAEESAAHVAREAKAEARRIGAEVNLLRVELESLVALSNVSDAERFEIVARLDALSAGEPAMTATNVERRWLAETQERLRNLRERARARLDHELTSMAGRMEGAVEERIRTILRNDDLLTADALLAFVRERGNTVDGDVGRRRFFEFFPKQFAIVEEALGQGDKYRGSSDAWVAAWREVATSRGGGPPWVFGLPTAPVRGKPAHLAADMLEAWFKLKAAGDPAERNTSEASTLGAIKTVLDVLGLAPTCIEVHQLRPYQLRIATKPITSRARALVPALGSNRGGNYTITCTWKRPNAEEILRMVGDTSVLGAGIVLYFARLSHQRRKELAALCRERRQTVVVVDDIIVAALCAERDDRLPAMLALTLPFTYSVPYSVMGGPVAPEMFYGRNVDRQLLKEPRGTCFIYGGRQLGKTALLTSVQREFHAPAEGRIALYIDLKAAEVASGWPVERIWHEIAVRLAELGVLPRPDAVTSISSASVTEAIVAWLEDNGERRILLLLDECDAFLEADGVRASEGRDDTFLHSVRLRALMDSTTFRFKVVFAGLHNVLRTVSQSNHPLGQLGHARCIGPLSEASDLREAQSLVRLPFEVMGFSFADPSLVLRILREANWYPSLVQLYCAQLLLHLHDQRRDGPPYEVTETDLNVVSGGEALREGIRYRFRLTLQLDQRYEVVAYTLLHTLLGDAGRMARGFEPLWILAEASGWWPEGFRDTDAQTFSVLLDEMVGLGVLRVVRGEGPNAPARYTLRNANTRVLLGGQGDIEAGLLKERRPPTEYRPARYRALLAKSERDRAPRRSPFTAQQEAELRRVDDDVRPVTAIVGCLAAGLADVEAAVERAVGPGVAVFADIGADRSRLDSVFHEAPADARLIVTTAQRWSTQDWEGAREAVVHVREQGRLLRLLVVVDPDAAWHGLGALAGTRAIGVIKLRPWDVEFLRQWLEDFGLANVDGTLQTTGGWPLLLALIEKQAGDQPEQLERAIGALDAATYDQGVGHALLPYFGLSDARRVEALSALAAFCDGDPNAALTARDLSVYLSRPEEEIDRTMAWAELLSLVRRHEAGGWAPEKLVGRIAPRPMS